MALVGSAVGLGNIWRFPFLVGENGGAAFVIIYLGIVFMIGIPLVLSEYLIGKGAQRGPVGAFRALAPQNRVFRHQGLLCIVIGFTILGVYNVVSGWVLESLVESIKTGFQGQSPEQISRNFTDFTSSVWKPILYCTGYMVITSLIVGRGIEKGIEKWNKILMPLLFAMLVALCINSLTLSGAGDAIEFLTKPNWNQVTFQTVLDALGQVFFTLSVGMGIMMTYGSYVRGSENMFRSKATASVIDSCAAMLAALMIFPAVFTFNLEAAQGPELVFIALPNVFAQMGTGGWIASVLFFGVLTIAAITSAISIFEMLVTITIEELKASRRNATIGVAGASLLLSSLCAWSMGVFNGFDGLVNKFLLPVFGIMCVMFVGWVLRRKVVEDIFTSQGRYSLRIFRVFYFIVRWVAPVAIMCIMLGAFGVI